MINDVVEFNKRRNQLKWDLDLELKMLREEIREFWEAETIAERVDAFVDTEYVWFGTKVKASYNTIALHKDLTKSVEDSLTLMQEYLFKELNSKVWEVIENARKIVCKANALKGSKLDKDGKVLKDEAYKEAIDATKQIALMIEEVTKPRSY